MYVSINGRKGTVMGRNRFGRRALLGLATLMLLLLVATGSVAREENPTEVTDEASGTLETYFSVPGPTSGTQVQKVSVKWSEKEVFNARTGDSLGKPKLKVSGSVEWSDDRTFESLL